MISADDFAPRQRHGSLMRVLYYLPYNRGGFIDYAHAQANALVAAGADVTLLCPGGFPRKEGVNYTIRPILREPDMGSGIGHRFAQLRELFGNFRTLSSVITSDGFDRVLFASYKEYFAPFWAGQLRRLAGAGVVFGAILHDPVRDFALGPLWWHRWSIACGYSFLREAFVHEPIELDTVRPMPRLRTTVIPHGVFDFLPATETREVARARLGLPKDAPVMLAFGYIRDGKNLDLVLRAMQKLPDIFLLVAGSAQAGGQKSAAFYQDLARELGVADRCRWQIGYVPVAETGNFFVAADVILLTYNRAFRSASGVLNTAVFFRKPCIASAGAGNLQSVVRKYGLGVWVEPDDVGSLTGGIRQWMRSPPEAEWAAYCRDNSWQRNAEIVLHQME
jgi:glycosyltransferase involved in cell wall biosynthesis